jgi:ferric-dicitrate binding protein FerR (iron transport regulator)
MENEMDHIKRQLLIAKAVHNDIREYASYDVEAAYRKVNRRTKRLERKHILTSLLLRAAAILILPLLTSTAVLSYLYIKQLSSKAMAYYTVTAAPGTVTQVYLPDSSKVWLNAGSSLRYPASFSSGERQVNLSGEGYFEVKSDPANPFYVSLSEVMRVKAYGTKFNVSSYEDDTAIETVLETGLVDVEFNTQSVRLSPSEQASFDKAQKKVVITSVRIDEKTSWKEGKLMFRNASLEEVIKSLSRRYNVDIVLHKETEKTYKFRASFSNETITQVLNYMKLAAPIEWSITETRQRTDSSYEAQRIDIHIK